MDAMDAVPRPNPELNTARRANSADAMSESHSRGARLMIHARFLRRRTRVDGAL